MSVSQQKQNLDHILDAIRDLESAAGVDQTLQRLMALATDLTGSESTSVLEFDEASNALRFIAAPWFHQQPLKKIAVPLVGSLAGWTFQNSKTLRVNNVSKDPRHFKAVDQAINFTTSSLLAAPIIYKGTAIGVIEVVNKTNHRHYTEEDATLLELLASFAAFAIWNSRLEARVEKVQNEFAELDRRKSNFIAIASHELRTPLGLILGHATFLKEMVAPEHRDPVETIIHNTTRLKDIVESLTEVDNYESGVARLHRNKISISRVVEDVLAAFKEMAEENNITLKTEMGASMTDFFLDVDENKVTVAISNLVRNAITFTNEGGQVLVQVDQVPDYVQVAVIDNGIGIPAKDLPHVFERFFQVESHLTRHYSGMGLGLTVAKTMIDLHGGRIWVESKEGQGSKFTILLPVQSSRDLPPKTPPS